jgi:hypothetical protein
LWEGIQHPQVIKSQNSILVEETPEKPVVGAEDIEEVVDLEDNQEGGTVVVVDITIEVAVEAVFRTTGAITNRMI